ncbi:MAG: hypothetical protein KY454_07720 [Actinobacteria bacterium]|nr:hypothetical protein [Actinomycetota bacterium]MBW3650878.1 hypothetical protein [Actinomycetota bacterium]
MSQGWQEDDLGGHPVRRFPLCVSAAALALAWARQEEAPAGATVVVEREVSPLGRIGRLWTQTPENSLVCAVVLRPALAAEEADVVWLIGGLAAAEAAQSQAGMEVGTWWPDDVVRADTLEPVATLKAEVQLGPGRVRSGVVTFRFDLERLSLDADSRDPLLAALLRALDTGAERVEEGGSRTVAEAYEEHSALLGRRVKIDLLPKGTTRGTASRLDRLGRLELQSSTGMIEHIGIDTLRKLEAV